MNLIDEMANEAMSDDYFVELFGLAEKMYWQHIIENPSWTALTLTSSQFDDLLTFADILSLSSNPSHRNTALKVISCLQPGFSNNPKYQYFSKGIMVRLGNFPGYKLLSGNDPAFWYRQAALQDHDLAIDKCNELGISLDNEITDKEGLRKKLKCRVFPLNYLPSYKYTVICSNYKGKWILSRHKKRNTWETQGGHIEPGETPLEAAKRELFEESGIRDADVYPVCDYWGFNPFHCSNGMVFLAVVHSIGVLPESEMQEIGMFEELPENLTYPQTSPVLYQEAEKLLRSLEKK